MDNTLEEISPSVKTISSVQYLQCTFTQMNLQWIYLMLNEIPLNIHSTNVQLCVQKTNTNIINMQTITDPRVEQNYMCVKTYEFDAFF